MRSVFELVRIVGDATQGLSQEGPADVVQRDLTVRLLRVRDAVDVVHPADEVDGIGRLVVTEREPDGDLELDHVDGDGPGDLRRTVRLELKIRRERCLAVARVEAEGEGLAVDVVEVNPDPEPRGELSQLGHVVRVGRTHLDIRSEERCVRGGRIVDDELQIHERWRYRVPELGRAVELELDDRIGAPECLPAVEQFLELLPDEIERDRLVTRERCGAQRWVRIEERGKSSSVVDPHVLVTILVEHHSGHRPRIGLVLAEEERHAIVEHPLIRVGHDVDEDDRQDHVPEKDRVGRERKIDAIVGIAGIGERLTWRDVVGDRDVLTGRRTLTVDDVDAQPGVVVLAAAVRVEFDRHAGQDGVRHGCGARRNGLNLGAYAVIVAIVLVENDPGEPLDVRIERREHRPVVQGDGQGVVEPPGVTRLREDVDVHRWKQEFLDRYRLGTQPDEDVVSRVVPESLPLARIDGAAQVGVLVEPIGVVVPVRLKVGHVGGGSRGTR